MRGRFITLEGVEGAGKSTQRDVVHAALLRAGIDVTLTREPGGSDIAERIRALLLDKRNQGMAADAELLLMFAARAEHLCKTILPALEGGCWVLCDRFTDATYAYQGGGRGLQRERIAVLEEFVQGALRPDLTLWFDLPAATGLARALDRSAPDRFESEAVAFFERVGAEYRRIADAEPCRVRRIDADRPLDAVAADVRRLVEQFVQQSFAGVSDRLNHAVGGEPVIEPASPAPADLSDSPRRMS
ncbi:MAG: dTMP kinase [Thiohalocapsa sp.]